MLEKILSEIRKNKLISVRELAIHMDTSPALVEQMLKSLVRLGYLHSLDACDTEDCSGCSIGSSCNPKSRSQIWQADGEKYSQD